MMNLKRASTSLPISSVKMRSVSGPSLTRHAQQAPGGRVEGGPAQFLGLHLAQALEAHDLGPRVLGQTRHDAVAIGLVERPEGLLAVVHAKERRLRQVHEAALDERAQVPVEEREQQRRDVVAVGVGVHHEDDLVVAQALQVELLAHAAAERGDDVLQLLVRQHLLQRRLLGVEHLAAQRKDRLVACARGPAWPSRRRSRPRR